MIAAWLPGVLLASVLLLAGCSDDDGGSGEADERPSDGTSGTAWEPTPGLCEILSVEERAGLLALDKPGRLAGQLDQEKGCAWIDREDPAVQLVLVSIPTTEWFRDLPGAIEAQLAIPDLDAGQRADLEAIQAEVQSMEAGQTHELCGLFSRLAEVQGYPAGSATTVYVTRGTAGLSAQNCEGDTFTSLVGRSAAIGDSPAMLEAYESAIGKVVAAR